VDISNRLFNDIYQVQCYTAPNDRTKRSDELEQVWIKAHIEAYFEGNFT